jgi:hypothetical protein
MSHTIIYNSELQIVEVTIQGDYTLAEAKQLLFETVEIIKNHHCYLILTDLRNAKVGISTLQQYNAPELFREAFAASGIDVSKIKRAVVIPNITETYKFAENVVVNRGQKMRLFLDIVEAKEWLLEQSPLHSPVRQTNFVQSCLIVSGNQLWLTAHCCLAD